MKDSKGHVVELQSVRGIAALVVLIGHALSYYSVPDWFVYLQERSVNAHGAVVIFFVLSGYVLTLSLSSKPLTKATILQFYIRRIFRIYPAIWCSSLLALAYLFVLHWRIQVPGTSVWFQERFQTGRAGPIFIVASFAGCLAYLLPPLWSIFVELVASVFMPLISWAARRRGAVFATLFVCSLALSFALGGWSYYHFAEYMIDFVCGAWLCLVPEGLIGRWISLPKLVRYGIATLSVFALLSCRFIDNWLPSNPVGNLVELLPAWIIVGSIVHGGVRPAFLRFTPIVRLGDISYSFYLIHFPVMCIVAKAMYLTLGNIDHITLSILLVVLTAIPTVILSSLQYQYVELQGIEWGKKVTRWLSPSTSPKPRPSPPTGLSAEPDVIEAPRAAEIG